jgi:hypothetical protein
VPLLTPTINTGYWPTTVGILLAFGVIAARSHVLAEDRSDGRYRLGSQGGGRLTPASANLLQLLRKVVSFAADACREGTFVTPTEPLIVREHHWFSEPTEPVGRKFVFGIVFAQFVFFVSGGSGRRRSYRCSGWCTGGSPVKCR